MREGGAEGVCVAQVLTVGNGEYGRLGNGGSSDVLEPAPLDFFEPTFVP